jgi:putative colanic acid biosynthesis acetyltransferase WcaF
MKESLEQKSVTNVLDIKANRAERKWTPREQVGRFAWALLIPFWRFSPRPFWAFRRVMLRLFGGVVGKNVHIYPSVRIAIPWNVALGDYCAVGDNAILYSLGVISIEARATVSQGAHLCAGTHDWRDPSMPLVKAPIRIESDAWVCADAFIGPGVSVGARSIVGARAVVVRDIESDTIVAGNPARKIRDRNMSFGAK